MSLNLKFDIGDLEMTLGPAQQLENELESLIQALHRETTPIL